MKRPPPPGFTPRSFDDRLADWISDTKFLEKNNLEQTTREFFTILRSQKTRSSYLRALQRCFKDILRTGISTPADITTERIQLHLNSICSMVPADPSKDRHIATRALALSALRKYFGYLLKMKRITHNPATDATLNIPAKLEGKTNALTPAEVKCVLATIDATTPQGRRDRALIAFITFTGCRIGAALKLVHSGIRDDGTLLFHEKGNKPHRLPMPARLVPYLDAYLADLLHPEQHEPVFRPWNKTHKRFLPEPVAYLQAYHMILARVRAAGIHRRISAHSFRATTITGLIKAGMPLHKVKAFANHKRIDTTLLYNRDPDVKPEDLEYLDKAFK